MSDDNESSTRNYFDTFKMGGLAYTQNGNIAEYSKKQLKEGAGPFLRDAASQIYYADGSDMLGNRGFIVSFLHVPSEDYVHFKAFINSFNETYSSDWSSDSVYGRTDPIKMFKQTTRSITLSLIVPASSEGEGFENLGKVQQLLSYLYPSYEKVDNALTISQSPLVRMRIMNLIRKTKVVGVKPEEGAEPVQGQQAYGKYQYERGSYSDHKSAVENRSKSAASKGLLGIIKNVSVNHNMDNPDLGSFILADGVVVPRAIEVTLDFDVLHEHTLGWDGDKFSDVMFPYGVHDDEAMKEELLTQQKQTAAASAVQAQIKRFEDEEEALLSEQQRQNAIAAGHVVASGIAADGSIQYELTNRGKRASKKHNNRLNATADWNPFNARPYPDGGAESEEAQNTTAYLAEMTEMVQ